MTQIVTKTQPPAKRNGRIDPIAFFERFGVLIFMFLLLIFSRRRTVTSCQNAIFSTS